MNLDLSLYLVLDPVQCGGHARALEVTRAALDGGATIVQLRAPEWHKRAWLELALDLLPLTRRHGVPLIINDHIDVALAAGADGVHVGQNDLPPDIARKLLGPQALIGLSVSNAQQVDHANPLGAMIDYVGVGPVFDTPTKPDASAACGIDGLAALCARSLHPTVAIGGIQLHNAADVKRAGPGGIAVVSAICTAADPRLAALRLLESS
ncbi:thiamine-phosphate synthase [Caballeronia mineralivorans PML1(12)]|uniref:Thiamine-phosphate synthase n=1 Tax=Caballeronia mineralivorans PML1(12) TaxID=908627 RepID=A0A0J1CMJ1_9BURK|nr:thiamine phosphate synthase [Caballeronia mineralivorans]KLU21749.1 thiamine-phosphate synthase [Caballeronia mineralivorans PML1(12)]